MLEIVLWATTILMVGILPVISPTIITDGHPWKKNGPLQFLQLLRGHPTQIVEVHDHGPPKWIGLHDVERLLELLESTEAASPVMESVCPSIPERPSTVGKQAAYLLVGHLRNRYPPSGNSDLQFDSLNHIRELIYLEQLNAGELLQADQKYPAAFKAYLSGIKFLGSRYKLSNVIDDTEMKRTLAESEKAKGNLEKATNLMHNVLKSRIHGFQMP